MRAEQEGEMDIKKLLIEAAKLKKRIAKGYGKR